MLSTTVAQHYGPDDSLERRLDDALRSVGDGTGSPVSPEDTAAVDQFHVGGLEATQALSELLAPSSAWDVVDLGSGLGGPSRYLAQTYDCRVVGVDITESYCRAATTLARRAGIPRDRLTYGVADATSLPLAAESFDGAWSQHVSMNIAAKPDYYAEVRRVLKRGGRFVFHDVVEGPTTPILYPVPWARTPAISYLQSANAMRQTIEAAGFACVAWQDVAPQAAQFLQAVLTRSHGGATPRLGLHLLLGPALPEMLRNFHQNIVEGRCGVVQAVFERAA